MKKIFFFVFALVCVVSAKAQIIDNQWKSYNMTNMQLKEWLAKDAGSIADTVTIVCARYVDSYHVDTFLYASFVNNKLIEKNDAYLNTEEAQLYSWWLGGDLYIYEGGRTKIYLSGSVSSHVPFGFDLEEDTTYAAFIGKGEFYANTLNNGRELSIVYSSANPNIVKVNAQTGAIEVMAVGDATITASYAGEAGVYPAYQASYTMTVVDRPFDDYEMVDLENLEIDEYSYWYQSGSCSYDPKTYTLTLDNYTLVASEYLWFQFFIFGVSRPSPIPLNVYVKGDCKIISRGGAIHAGADVIFRGDEGATLAMFSYIPPIESHKCIVDGISLSLSSESHPNFEGDVFQVKNGSYVHLQESAYFAGETDHIMQLLFGDLEMDSEIGILTKGVHYGTEEIEQYDEIQTITTFFFADNTIAPVVEIGKVQRPKPITGETSPVGVSMGSVDVTYNPAGTEIGGVFYTITENDSIVPGEGCLEISSTMSEIEMQQIAGIFSSASLALAQNFRGLSFLLPAGEGSITLNARTLGIHQLGIKIGEEKDSLLVLNEKKTVTIQYNIAEPQLVFIYGFVEASDEDPQSAPYKAMRRARMEGSDGSVKIYDITIAPQTIIEPTAIEMTYDQLPRTIKVIRDGQILILRGDKTYTIQGHEVQQ